MVYNMKTISITVDEDILVRLDRLVDDCREAGSNRSRLIREAMKDYVVRMERLIEEEREREIFGRNRAQLRKQATALVREQARQ